MITDEEVEDLRAFVIRKEAELYAARAQNAWLRGCLVFVALTLLLQTIFVAWRLL